MATRYRMREKRKMIPAGAEPASARRTEVRLSVRRELTLRIRRGEYSPGAWLPTERELAQEFGVDRATVRAALGDLAEEGLIVREYGRRPWVSETFLPDMLRGRDVEPMTIAVILPLQPGRLAGAAILRGIARALRGVEADTARLLLYDTSDEDPEGASRREQLALQAVERDGPAGVIFWGRDDARTLPRLESLKARRTPVVFVHRAPTRTDGDFIGADHRWGVAEAVNHLAGLGHRRIAFVGSESGPYPVVEQIEGFQAAMTAHSLPLLSGCLLQLSEGAPQDAAVGQMIAQSEPPTAVVAADDTIVTRIYEAMARAGKRIPGDMSLVGFDDREQSAVPPSAFLTAVHQPYERIGQRAAEMVLQRIRERSGESRESGFQHVLLSTELVVRASTGPVPSPSPARAAA